MDAAGRRGHRLRTRRSLILPAATGIAPVLTPLAAIGLAITMLGAAATHTRRKEPPAIGVNLALLALAAIIATGRLNAV